MLTAFAGGPFVVGLLALGPRGVTGSIAVVFFVGWCLYVIAVGGDGLPMFRFLVPALPFLALAAGSALSRTLGNRRGTALVAAGFAVALTVVPGWQSPENAYRNWDRTVFVPKIIRVGKALRDLVGPDASIALLPAGAIPYYSGLRIIDMLALNDPVVARKQMPFTQGLPGHWKYDAAEVLRQGPDYVLLGNVDVTAEPRGGAIAPAFQVEADLLALEAFQTAYELVSFPLPGGGWLNCYRRVGAPPAPVAPRRSTQQ